MLSISLIQTGELIARKSFYDTYQLLILFMGVVFIGMARLSHSKTIISAFGTLLNFKTEVAFNDSIKINPTGSFFLILNFIFSGSLLLFLATQSVFQNNVTHYFFSFGLTMIILINYIIGIYLVAFLTSDSTKLPIGQLHNLNFIHVCGIVAIIIDLPLLLNAQWNQEFSMFAIAIFSVLFAIRLVKVSSFAFQENISWYYIILYLCTLEIFPCFMFTHVVFKFFEL